MAKNSIFYLPQPYIKNAIRRAIEVSGKGLTDFSRLLTMGQNIPLVLSDTKFQEIANFYGVFPGAELFMHFRSVNLLMSVSLKHRNNPQKFIMKLDFQPLEIPEKDLVQMLSDSADQNYSLNKKKLQ